MRYRLRTLLILMAVGPPMSAVVAIKWTEYRAEQQRQAAARDSVRKALAWLARRQQQRDDGSWNPSYPAIDDPP